MAERTERSFSDASSQEGSEWERGRSIEDAQSVVQDLLERAVASIQASNNQASRRRVRQRLQRKLSDFLAKDQYDEAMQQFKVLCESRLGYVWRVADKHAEEPGVCYLHFNESNGHLEHCFV